ncbi:MAG: pyridoxamine 5'-phosphate oxidase family protein [Eubacteriales bacterium]
MRRSDREITDTERILDIVSRADTVHLAISDGEYPYVVPLSYGYEFKDGNIILYIHGASEGKKHILLEKDPRVCAEISIFKGYAETGHSFTCEYESVIGYGTAEKITGKDAEHGTELLLSHCGYGGREYNKDILNKMTLYKITLVSFSGKCRFVKRQTSEEG